MKASSCFPCTVGLSVKIGSARSVLGARQGRPLSNVHCIFPELKHGSDIYRRQMRDRATYVSPVNVPLLCLPFSTTDTYSPIAAALHI